MSAQAQKAGLPALIGRGLRGLTGMFGAPAPARGQPGAAYMRNEWSPVFQNWYPILRDPREDVRAAYWRAAARTIDMVHNSGWIAGVVNKGCASIMGDGLRLAAKPDADALGWSQPSAADWARKAERRFELWASTPLECDAAGKSDIHKQCKASLRTSFATGEYLQWMRWLPRSQSATSTKIHLVPAHRLTQESNGYDLFQGVRIDKNGLPRSYRLRLTTPIMETGEIFEVAARDSGNRPVLHHCFDGDVGQMRGISIFAPVLQVLRQYDQLSNATLTAALLQAIFSATVTSPSPTADILGAFEDQDGKGGDGGDFDAWMDARAGWYDKTKIDLGGMGKLAHLFPGEKLDFNRSETPNSNFEPFARFLLREIAAAAGFTTEDMTGDYNGATYSSIRMSTTTNWPIQLWRRKHLAAPFYQTAYECWLEEDIERGLTPFPGGIAAFIANRTAACRADWRGPAKPQADDLKFAAANKIHKELGVVSDEHICAEMGFDWEDVYEQRAREKAARERLGLPENVVSGSTVVDVDKQDDAELAGDRDRGENRDDGKDKNKGGAGK
jgi:lambda family phage portal protein